MISNDIAHRRLNTDGTTDLVVYQPNIVPTIVLSLVVVILSIAFYLDAPAGPVHDLQETKAKYACLESKHRTYLEDQGLTLKSTMKQGAVEGTLKSRSTMP